MAALTKHKALEKAVRDYIECFEHGATMSRVRWYRIFKEILDAENLASDNSGKL